MQGSGDPSDRKHPKAIVPCLSPPKNSAHRNIVYSPQNPYLSGPPAIISPANQDPVRSPAFITRSLPHSDPRHQGPCIQPRKCDNHSIRAEPSKSVFLKNGHPHFPNRAGKPGLPRLDCRRPSTPNGLSGGLQEFALTALDRAYFHKTFMEPPLSKLLPRASPVRKPISRRPSQGRFGDVRIFRLNR